MTNRDEKIARVCEEIECRLTLIGSTAIEDRLQDGVPDCIRFLRSAGVKVWVLTGDKVETAVNIGFSSGLLDNQIEQLYVIKPDTSDIKLELAEASAKVSRNSVHYDHALIVAGDSMLKIQNSDTLKKDFEDLMDKVKVVLACRVSPKQKADIVNIVRSKYPKKVTLSIGDGANDVNMITAAHVGVGIRGKEGQQAARSADYVIGQFRFLQPLMFVHGREAYRKNSYIVLYNFYKNCLFVVPQYWYGFFSVQSG